MVVKSTPPKELTHLSGPWTKYDRLCPDQVQALEPDSGEIDGTRVGAVRGSQLWGCMPTWLEPCSQATCSQASCTQCSACETARENLEYTASIGILGLAVFGDGLIVLPVPREATVLDPRTWFAWKPVVEILGAGTHNKVIRSSEGKKASSPINGAESQASEGCWDGLLLGEEGGSGISNVSVNTDGVLRFRILRSRATSILGGQERETEEAFTANLSMAHDFFDRGRPERLVRPIFHRSRDGDIRHVGHLHLSLKVDNHIHSDIPDESAPANCAAVSITQSAHNTFATKPPQRVRVPEDYPTVQAALDAIFPGSRDDATSHIILNSGTHRGNAHLRKNVVLEAGPGASPIVEGNVVIEAGGERAELRKLEVHGSVAARAGKPVISGCTILQAGATVSKASASSTPAVAALTISGSNVQPTIEGNTIRQGYGAGVLFENGAQGTFRDNTVLGNTASGIEVRDFGTKPTVEDNRIQENRQHGLFVHYGGSGSFSNNDVHRNLLYGIMLKADTGSGLVVKSNRVHENEQGGILAEGLGDSIAERTIGDNEEIGPPRAVQEAAWTVYTPR